MMDHITTTAIIGNSMLSVPTSHVATHVSGAADGMLAPGERQIDVPFGLRYLLAPRRALAVLNEEMHV